jgi:hypothetical protein
MFCSQAAKCFLIVLVGALLLDTNVDAGPPLNLDNSEWGFEVMRTSFKAKAKGLGQVKVSGNQGVQVTLLPGNVWVAVIDGTLILRGTYTRADETSKRLALTLDAASIAFLRDLYTLQTQAAAAAEGVPITADFAFAGAKMTVKIKPQAKTGTATAKLKAKLKFAGAIFSPGGETSGKVIGKLKGRSAPIPLTDITAP